MSPPAEARHAHCKRQPGRLARRFSAPPAGSALECTAAVGSEHIYTYIYMYTYAYACVDVKPSKKCTKRHMLEGVTVPNIFWGWNPGSREVIKGGGVSLTGFGSRVAERVQVPNI